MELLKKIKTSKEMIASLQNQLASAEDYLKWGTGPNSAEIEVKCISNFNGLYYGEVSKKT